MPPACSCSMVWEPRSHGRRVISVSDLGIFFIDTSSGLVSSPMRSGIAMWWRMEKPIDRCEQLEGPVAPSRSFSVPCQPCGGGSRCTDGQMLQSKCAAMSQNLKIIGKYLDHAHEAAAYTRGLQLGTRMAGLPSMCKVNILGPLASSDNLMAAMSLSGARPC